ncbi:hypothetical protein LCGC14_3123890 [marine sediment metagenome]|uniref:ribose-phosphate diphosphokinase n=1 Tax=marine sediment metagenome TaxID=412755 RepID=A0A0F8WQD9_9ZZZZ
MIIFLTSLLVVFSSLCSLGYSLEKDIDKDSFILFAGNSNPDLAGEVANILGVDINEAEVGRFHDGEIKIKIKDNVKGKDVYILQSICTTKDASVNDNLMELYLLIRACKRSSAKRVVAVTNFLFVPYFIRKDLNKVVVVALHAGTITRAIKFIDGLNRYNVDSRLAVFTPLLKKNYLDDIFLIGDVKDSDVLIINDMCDTAESVVAAVKELKRNGANKIYAWSTHGLFSQDAIDKIKNSDIDEMIITDSIPLRQDLPNNITQISIAPLIAAAIKKTQKGESLSNLYQY